MSMTARAGAARAWRRSRWSPLAGCGSEDDVAAAEDNAKLTVATTVAPITSIVANIGGDRADVTGIVPEGTNSHTFEPKPSVAELLSKADVVFVNGLSSRTRPSSWPRQNLKDGAEIVELGTQTITAERVHLRLLVPEVRRQAQPAPLDRPAATRARYARDRRATTWRRRDPANAAYYAANYAQVRRAWSTSSTAAMRTSFATIPAAERKLLTYHDAYAYFAGTTAGRSSARSRSSDFEDPTPKEVAEPDRPGRGRAGCRRSSAPRCSRARCSQQIGKETGVEYVDVLRDDDLPGAPGDADHSWLGLMRFDYVTMTEALGGDASALRALRRRATSPPTRRTTRNERAR